MFELVDAKKRIEIVASKTLQDKNFKKMFSMNEFKKVEQLLEELKHLECKDNQKIKLTDTEDKIIIEIL